MSEAEQPSAVTNEELVYPLDACPPPGEMFVVGFQHVLAMFAGIVTPALIVGGNLGLDVRQQSFLVGMALFTSGLATFTQVHRIGPLGSGLLSVQGTSFTFLKPVLQAGEAGGLPLIFGMSILGAPGAVLVSRVVARVRRLFPPIVSGTAVTLIGLSLIRVGMTDFAGGRGAADFGSPKNLGLALLVLTVIVLLNRFATGLVKVGAVMFGIATGYLVAAALGYVDFSALRGADWFTLPRPLQYGIALDFKYFLPWFLAYVVVSIETVGDLTATSAVSNQPITGEVFRRRLAGGILADAFGSVVAALFNSMPNTTFAQNNGIIQMTGVASRRVGYAVATVLVLLGLSPKLGALVSLMPKPVLGGATLVLFGMVSAAGIRIVSMARLGGREMLILAIALGAGLGIESVPEALAKTPDLVRITFGTGLVTGTMVALALNLVLPEVPARRPPRPVPIP